MGNGRDSFMWYLVCIEESTTADASSNLVPRARLSKLTDVSVAVAVVVAVAGVEL